MRSRSIVVALLAVALVAAGCSSNPGVSATARQQETPGTGTTGDSTPGTTGGTAAPGDTTAPASAISWGACNDPSATDTNLQCATIDVPLDYDHPAGTALSIALVKVPAKGARTGAVLMNPGGPGGSGFDFAAQSGGAIQTAMGLDAYDLVGFDPRGVDRSGGIKCVDDAFQDQHLYLDTTPDTPEEQQLLDEADTGFIAGCKQHYADTLRFYSTANTARDMDRIRAGLGDTTISYLGISYGTYLGATYATLFPDRVKAMVLDSAYEPNDDSVDQQYLTQIVGFEGAFNDWAKDCQGDAACPFHAADVGARWDALRVTLDQHPVAAKDGRMANQAVLDTATQAALYSKADWPVLSSALAKVAQGDPAELFSMADGYEHRNADGTFDSLFQSIGIIECASGIQQQTPKDPATLLQQLHQQAPRMAADITLDDLTKAGHDCEQLTGTVTPVALHYAGTAPIVVVGGQNDPATPIRWAQKMTGELGTTARLLTFTGEGHGQLLASKCVTDAEAAVLTNGTLPDSGAVCSPDPTVQQPDWWTTVPVPTGVGPVVQLPAVMSALGLTDTVGFGELRTTTLGLDGTTSAYEQALATINFRSLGAQDLGIAGTAETGFLSPTGDLLVIVVLSPAAFDTKELGDLKAGVPANTTLVLVAYVAQ